MRNARTGTIPRAAARRHVACCALGIAGFAASLAVPVSSSPSRQGGALAAETARPAGRPQAGFRRLAPGALTVIPPRFSSDSHSLRGDLLEATEGLADLRWTPLQAAGNTTLVERAKDREFQREIWCLEFAFKPPRFIDVDVPAGDLKMQRKRLWYLLYRVKNVGGRRTAVDPADPTQRKIEPIEPPVAVRFVPHFVLESLEGLSSDDGDTAYRSYLDRVVPSAMGPIRRREDPARTLYDSASMAATDIQPGEERWAAAVWQDVDPRIDFFTIAVRGLTNAIRWRRNRDADFSRPLPPASQMDHAVASLRLDFWRPGDDRDEVEEEVTVGYAGMFERITLGGKLLEAIARPSMVKSQPVSGLAAAGLSWSDLVVPDEALAGGELVPLAKVVRAVAAVKQPEERGRIVRGVFGDPGVDALEQLSRALAAPADADRDAVRRRALATVGLNPEQVARDPLTAIAALIDSLAATAPGEPRRRQAQEFFGPAANRVDRLAKGVALARTLATLTDVAIDRRQVGSADGMAAFNDIWAVLKTVPDPAEREKLVAGLFGPGGPSLFARATEVTEGIDHQWVFKYEIKDE